MLSCGTGFGGLWAAVAGLLVVCSFRSCAEYILERAKQANGDLRRAAQPLVSQTSLTDLVLIGGARAIPLQRCYVEEPIADAHSSCSDMPIRRCKRFSWKSRAEAASSGMESCLPCLTQRHFCSLCSAPTQLLAQLITSQN